MKRQKGWRISCDVVEVTERLENELCCDYNYELCSFSKFSVTSPTSQLNSPSLPSLYLRHSSFSNPSVASPTSQLILKPVFRFSYVTSSSLTSPGEPPMYPISFIRALYAKLRFWTSSEQNNHIILKILQIITLSLSLK